MIIARMPASALWSLAATWLAFGAPAAAEPTTPSVGPQQQRPEIRVGVDEGDIRGDDHRALQSAIDYVAGLGGGTVRVGPGRFRMRNALALRSNVDVIGTPGKTVLAACDGFKTRLASDGGANERQITVEDPSGLRVGDGVSVQCKRNGGGFAVSTATLVARLNANTFRLSAPLYLDYMVADRAVAGLAFPVIGGWNVRNASVEGITVDGNRAKAEYLNGCRGGGIFLFECEAVSIRNCVVREYKGDGISFQVSARTTVEDCLIENNDGLGLHPGSGSEHAVVRRNRSCGNGQDGLYVCWRVKHGVFENNDIRDNKRVGISIGHKDTDNVFRNNTVIGNAGAGVLFRDETEAMGAHRNVFEDNRILDNGRAARPGDPTPCIVVRGHHHDVVFRRNTVGNSQAGGSAGVGIRAGPGAKGLKLEDNKFVNVRTETHLEK